jgi:hypothetical protein
MMACNDSDEGAELSRFNSGHSNRGQFYEVERDRFGFMYSGPLGLGECVTVVPAAELLAAVVCAALAEISAALPGERKA